MLANICDAPNKGANTCINIQYCYIDIPKQIVNTLQRVR